MEGGGGGGGGGGGSGGYLYGNVFPPPPPNFHQQQGPPFSAIDKFLWDQEQSYNFSSSSSCQNQEILNNFPPLTTTTTNHVNFYDNNSSLLYNTIHGLLHQDSSFINDGFFMDVRGGGFDEEIDLMVEKTIGKKEKNNGGSNFSIKGQWIEEEDRKLIRLVKQNGVKKWAQIAEKMVGRAGKQCRERWHNHLRPNIKKDNWSGEEEKILVESHMELGNRWAEIAKRIPGRTENSIKNHLNATKRRQLSKRNKKSSKKPNGNINHIPNPPPTILQDYIKNTTCPTYTAVTTTTTTAPPPPNSSSSADADAHLGLISTSDHHHDIDDSSSYLTQTYDDDEINFMKNLFGNANNTSSSMLENNISSLQPKEVDGYGGMFSLPAAAATNYMTAEFGDDENEYILYPEIYLSHLFDGSVAAAAVDSSAQSTGYEHQQQVSNMEGSGSGSGSGSERKEVDLIEMMMCNSQFSNASSSTNSFAF